MSLAIAGSKAMRNISSKDLVKELTIGWSLGNTMDATCFDTLDYKKDPIASETCWGAPKTTQALYNKLSDLGFNTFRIPTTWSGHFGDGPDYKINEQWMKRVHEIVDYALNTGGYAILNVHHETWNYAFSSNLNNAKTVLIALWKQIASEFANYDEHLIFEGLNEPRKVGDPVEWTGDQEGYNFVNEMNEVFIKTIRSTGGNNALRHLMIPPYAAGVMDASLNTFRVPRDDDKIIVSLHSYSPYNFALNNGSGAISNFYDGSEIDYVMNTIHQRYISQNIPVIIGEFGAMNRDNEVDRARWAEYYIKKATSIGVPCVLWDNAYYEGKGERFGAINRTTLEVVFPDYINGLMKGLGNKAITTRTRTITTTTTTSYSIPTNSNNNTCFSIKFGYNCCNECNVYYTDNDGKWGVENGNWCGIKDSCNIAQQDCWAKRLGYSCCQNNYEVIYTDNDGKWGVENGNWCGIN
ncbi:endoglucanase B [Piromyces finnis]|uniref:Endoglucanase B n=1 Tax=Piromyces finnis TaxID=1754191 RepID=A0A1Y1VLA8_9FUNG|nr:endoglucanase B [Piromyces finnis]|eukprot:ORX59269.1 endoglucanase B [Piromyces finnis]